MNIELFREFWKEFILMGIIFILYLILFVNQVFGVSDVTIDVYIEPSYHSCTIALMQMQDYYLEYEGPNLINITPVGDPIILENRAISCG